MRTRPFGRTGVQVSERGFGAWAIGGQSFGAVPAQQALAALARAEELDCNFVDTAAVYGESEALLGRFLAGRRSRWLLATKYSGQPQGLSALLHGQLKRMGTDHIDLYQLHFAPRGPEMVLYDELARLKQQGLVRFVGVSLRSAADIDSVLAQPVVDSLQLRFSLLDPDPLLARLPAVRARGVAVVARSVLKEGFLTGKYGPDTRFTDPSDQRREWPPERVRRAAHDAQALAWLATPARSAAQAALAYVLSFPEVSTAILSCKDVAQVEHNLGGAEPEPLDAATLQRIAQVQRRLGVAPVGRLGRLWRKLTRGQ